jgi:hypothetical protein
LLYLLTGDGSVDWLGSVGTLAVAPELALVAADGGI